MQENISWNRRDFIRNVSGLGIASTYSLLVRVPAVAAAETTAFTPPDFDAIAPAAPPSEWTATEHNMRLVDLECDFLVAGGGMAGVCAALAAARHGAKVVLVQNRSRLGGNASSEVRMHIVGADTHGHRSGWREGGILEELRLEDAANNPHWSWELWDLMLYDKIVSEPNITLLLDTSIYGATVKDGLIQEAMARCDLTEHIYRIKAKQYADCTGDCRLGLEAGAHFRTGHESREMHNESLAPETAGPETLGSSILFTSKQYDYPVPFTPPKWARKVTKEHLFKRGTGSWEYGYWWIEWGGKIDAIKDNEKIRFELLSIVMGVWDYIKNSGNHPDSANWGMDWIGMIPGKRASRRLVGAHYLTQNDMVDGNDKAFDDAVAIGGWSFDDHTSGGFDDSDIAPCSQTKIKEVYNIPLRALYSGNIQNLFMAGRNISASHVAFTSTRVMATCAVEGQAIGTAAALCASKGMAPQQLYDDKSLLKTFQQELLRDDQTIKGMANADPGDLARTATVRASSEVESSSAANVINGFVRDMNGEWKNRWGGPMTDSGAWLELAWNAPQTLSHVQLCFDSGFSRQLTLTGQFHARKNQIRGRQPETVKDYRLLYRDSTSGDWKELVAVADNYQRIRRHTFDPVKATALRIEITATNGNDEARIYEIRCYA